MSTSPLISVIIPTFNRSKLLMNALDSVFAQTLKDFEVLVIDDGSTDDTERAVQSYCSRNSLSEKIRYFKQANQGKSVALNVGLDAARGEWTAFLDSDDVWLPLKLQRQMETIKLLAGRCEACFTTAEFVNNPNWAKTSSERARQVFVGTYGELIDPALFIATKTHGIYVQTMLAKTGLCIKVCGFDKNLRVLEDYDFVFRLARKTGLCYVNDNLVKIDRTPNRPEGLIELFEVDEIRLQQMQYVYEKWLSSEDPLPERIRQGIYTQLRGVHSEWTNYYLKIQDNSRARQEARRALSYRWSAKTACKLLLTTLAPTFTRELVIKRG